MIAIFQQRLRKEAIEGIKVVQADVLNLKSVPENWKNFDLIISASMMEYLPSEKFVDALSGLKSRLSDTGSVVLFITRKNWLTWLLIVNWWKANSYDERDLEKYFRRAGFSTITFARFPFPYRHLSLWGHIVEAR
jgi:cyclopropane fatty-acyl-phospholipid synthase-like methyltransferase